jgi:hypothetical protein
MQAPLIKTMDHLEGHWICKRESLYDCDHGPCVGYEIEELGITIFTYGKDLNRISIHRHTDEAL